MAYIVNQYNALNTTNNIIKAIGLYVHTLGPNSFRNN